MTLKPPPLPDLNGLYMCGAERERERERERENEKERIRKREIIKIMCVKRKWKTINVMRGRNEEERM